MMLGIITYVMWELMEKWIDQEYPTFDNSTWSLVTDYDLGYESIKYYCDFDFEEDEEAKDWSEEKEEEALAMVNKAMKAFGYRPHRPTSYCGYSPYECEDDYTSNLSSNSNMEREASSSSSNMEGEASGSSNPKGNYTGSVMIPESELDDNSNSASSSNMDSSGEEDSDSSNPEGLYTGGLCTSKKQEY